MTLLWVPLNKRQHNNLFKTESQKRIFSKICNYSAHMHWDNDKYLVLIGFLNIDVTKAQHQLFNPTFENVLTGFIVYDVKGEFAKKKLAQR